jgi:hypothetical protein
MLFRRRDHEAIVAGDVDLAFRRWAKPSVRAGGTQVMPAGIVAFDEVDEIDPEEITDAEAIRAGRESAAEVRGELARAKQHGAPAWRIRFHWVGPDPRVALRERDDLEPADVETIAARLARFDAASRTGAWTEATLELIERRPETLAAELAAERGQERLAFKRNVRRLKEMGLTESLPQGYRLSPRGRAYVALRRRGRG